MLVGSVRTPQDQQVWVLLQAPTMAELHTEPEVQQILPVHTHSLSLHLPAALLTAVPLIMVNRLRHMKRRPSRTGTPVLKSRAPVTTGHSVELILIRHAL